MADVDHLPVDMRPAAPGSAVASNAAAAMGQEPISVANLMSLSDAKRAASDDAEKAFLERGLRRSERHGRGTGASYRHEPLASADASEETRPAFEGLPQPQSAGREQERR